MSRAQAVFAVALAATTALVLVVGLYVISSATWAGRWYRRRRP